MLCLLKDVANIDVYEQTPQPKDKNESADLGRIRYYRNECAHMNKCEISTEKFNSIWTDLTEVSICFNVHSMLKFDQKQYKQNSAIKEERQKDLKD